MQWRAMPCSLQVCRLHACNTTQSCWVDLKLDSIYGTFTSCYYTAHHLDILQGECVLAACSIILSLMLLIISNNCLRAERQSSHLFRWHIKAYWRAVPDSNVYTKLCDVPTGHWKHCRLFNGAVYWWQATVSLPLYDSELKRWRKRKEKVSFIALHIGSSFRSVMYTSHGATQPLCAH